MPVTNPLGPLEIAGPAASYTMLRHTIFTSECARPDFEYQPSKQDLISDASVAIKHQERMWHVLVLYVPFRR